MASKKSCKKLTFSGQTAKAIAASTVTFAVLLALVAIIFRFDCFLDYSITLPDYEKGHSCERSSLNKTS